MSAIAAAQAVFAKYAHTTEHAAMVAAKCGVPDSRCVGQHSVIAILCVQGTMGSPCESQ